MPPVDGQSPASQPRPLPIYGAQFLEHPRHLPVSGQQCSQTLPSRPFALCRHIAGWTQPCHSNATRAPIANPPNSAQLGGSLYHAPKLHPGLCSSVGVGPRTDRQTHRRAWPQYILCRLRVTQNVINYWCDTMCSQNLSVSELAFVVMTNGIIIMAALYNRGAIIFLPCSFYLLLSLFFFPRLISADGDWMSTILLHMAWP